MEAYKNDLNQFEDFISHTYSLTDVKEVKPVYIRSWIVDLHQKGISNRSINRKLSSLKTFYSFLRKRHGLVHNPLRKIINPKVEKRLPLTLRKDHLDHMFETEASINENDEHHLRDQLILDILYSCGLRRSELMNLKLTDIDPSRKMIRVIGKGNKERWIPISGDLLSKLHHYLPVRASMLKEGHSYLFITNKGEPLYPKWVYNFVRNKLNLYTTIERKSPHILRHSFATHLSDAGADLNAVKTLLGHASLASTQVYMHNTVEKLKKIYDQAHPKS